LITKEGGMFFCQTIKKFIILGSGFVVLTEVEVIRREPVKKIETSITISIERKKRLIEASQTLHLPVSDILAALMRKSRIKFRDNKALLWRAVRYQRVLPEKYHIMHVSFEPRCYEFGVSERLMFKFSVSYIYAVAIDLFLDQLVKRGLNARLSEDELTTNYLDAKYSIDYIADDFNEFWIVSWDRRLKMT